MTSSVPPIVPVFVYVPVRASTLPVTAPSMVSWPVPAMRSSPTVPDDVTVSCPPAASEVLLDGAADRQRPAGDPRVAADRPGDVDAAPGREDVTRDGPRDVDQATARDQVTVDGAIDPDRPGERVEVVRDGLAGRDGHRVAGPQLVAHRALGEGDSGQDRQQGDACRGCHEQAIRMPHRSALLSGSGLRRPGAGRSITQASAYGKPTIQSSCPLGRSARPSPVCARSRSRSGCRTSS